MRVYLRLQHIENETIYNGKVIESDSATILRVAEGLIHKPEYQIYKQVFGRDAGCVTQTENAIAIYRKLALSCTTLNLWGTIYVQTSNPSLRQLTAFVYISILYEVGRH